MNQAVLITTGVLREIHALAGKNYARKIIFNRGPYTGQQHRVASLNISKRTTNRLCATFCSINNAETAIGQPHFSAAFRPRRGRREERERENYRLAKADVDVALLHKSYGLSIVAAGSALNERSFAFSDLQPPRTRRGSVRGID